MTGKVLSDMLVSQLSAHGIASDVRRVKASLQAANTYNTTSAVITAFAKLLGELHDPQAAWRPQAVPRSETLPSSD